MYEVIWGERQGKKFDQLQNAVDFARLKVQDLPSGQAVSLWDEAGLIIGIVTDDANGITLHRLATWSDDEPEVQ